MTSEKTKLREGLVAPESQTVLDFLYHDARRVGSYLAQVDPSGHLTGVKETSGVEENEQTETGADVAGKFIVANIGSRLQTRTGSGTKDASERTYDPFWTNARIFIEQFTERSMIKSGISGAALGEIFHISGVLSVVDMSLLKPMLSIPEIQENILHAAVKENPNQSKELSERNATVSLKIIQHMPHLPQMRLVSNNNTACWGVLKTESLVVNMSDISIGHNLVIPGVWNVIGVLDSKPETEWNGEAIESPVNKRDLWSAMLGSPMIGEIVRVLPLLRSLGRPHHAYGVTPLLIYREVG